MKTTLLSLISLLMFFSCSQESQTKKAKRDNFGALELDTGNEDHFCIKTQKSEEGAKYLSYSFPKKFSPLFWEVKDGELSVKKAEQLRGQWETILSTNIYKGKTWSKDVDFESTGKDWTWLNEYSSACLDFLKQNYAGDVVVEECSSDFAYSVASKDVQDILGMSQILDKNTPNTKHCLLDDLNGYLEYKASRISDAAFCQELQNDPEHSPKLEEGEYLSVAIALPSSDSMDRQCAVYGSDLKVVSGIECPVGSNQCIVKSGNFETSTGRNEKYEVFKVESGVIAEDPHSMVTQVYTVSDVTEIIDTTVGQDTARPGEVATAFVFEKDAVEKDGKFCNSKKMEIDAPEESELPQLEIELEVCVDGKASDSDAKLIEDPTELTFSIDSTSKTVDLKSKADIENLTAVWLSDSVECDPEADCNLTKAKELKFRHPMFTGGGTQGLIYNE